MVAKQGAAQKSKLHGPAGIPITFAMSFISLGALTFSLGSFAGFGQWARWQFVGLFGVIECAVGLAAIIAPNVWRLPVAQVQVRPATEVELAASTTLIPHWSGAGRALAGLVMIAAAGVESGVEAGSLALLPFLLANAVSVFELSTLFAYAGVVHSDFDVIQIVIYRAGKESRLPAFSIGASVLHLLISLAALPIVRLASPSLLFGPALGPSVGAVAVSLAVAVLLGLAALVVWRRRLSWQAAPAQQREAEQAF